MLSNITYIVYKIFQTRSEFETYIFVDLNETDWRATQSCLNRKYKDYVYRKMLLQEYLKK